MSIKQNPSRGCGVDPWRALDDRSMWARCGSLWTMVMVRPWRSVEALKLLVLLVLLFLADTCATSAGAQYEVRFYKEGTNCTFVTSFVTSVTSYVVCHRLFLDFLWFSSFFCSFRVFFVGSCCFFTLLVLSIVRTPHFAYILPKHPKPENRKAEMVSQPWSCHSLGGTSGEPWGDETWNRCTVGEWWRHIEIIWTYLKYITVLDIYIYIHIYIYARLLRDCWGS